MKRTNVCFTGGGTAGHVYPAKPIIDQLLHDCPDMEIHWLGSKGGMEEDLVKPWPVSFKGIPSGKLRRYFSLRNFVDIFRIIFGFFSARRYLKKHSPAFLFSKGGFVTVPPVWAAKSLKIPVFSHDSDVDPGLATRLNAPKSRVIFIPYGESEKYYSKWKDKVVISGNPLRRDIYEASTDKIHQWLGYKGDKPILLVLGGSLGAKAVNQIVLDSLDILCEKFFVVHQMGKEHYIPSNRKDYRSYPFIFEELPSLMKIASLAISRAGAGSLWELSACNTPMVLIPLGQGSRGDQIRNAEIFHQRGWAAVLDQENLTSSELTDTVETMGPWGEEGRRALRAMENDPLPIALDIIMESIKEIL